MIHKPTVPRAKEVFICFEAFFPAGREQGAGETGEDEAGGEVCEGGFAREEGGVVGVPFGVVVV